MNQHFKLGDIVEDVITGFKGVVIVYLHYLYNQDRYALKSKELRDGKPMDHIFFDVTSLKFIEETNIEVPDFPEITIAMEDEAKDKISGYKGIVVGYGFWINGCIRIGIQSKNLTDEGVPVEEQWFPMDQVQITKKGKGIKIKKDKDPGGPMKNPTCIKDPK
jgi:hypothetical protein